MSRHTILAAALSVAAAAAGLTLPSVIAAVDGGAAAAPAINAVNADAEAFMQPMPFLTAAGLERFFRGRALVRQSWVVAPSKDVEISGLGPLYNRLACVSCHARNGRGQPPSRPDERMLSMLVRLSVPGQDEHGGPKPHPAYGGQLNEEGIPGVAGEGRAFVHWRQTATVPLPGGETVALRAPVLNFGELAYGPIDGALTSPRVGQQMVGLGLLDAINEETLHSLAAQAKPDGVKGRVNRVWNPETQRTEAGRFGYKANMPTLRTQIAGAFVGDMGITSPPFPQENCTAVQTACQQAPSGGPPDQPELSAARLDEIEFYLGYLAVPPRRNADDLSVRRGEALFVQNGCATCHRPELTTGEHPRLPRLSRQTIRPYTDLLLHDMGAGLSDGRPDYLASGREWRTPPLWGIGLTSAVSETAFYLHDGRARSLTEAIVWHGGEAQTARARFARLDPAARAALIAFLNSL